MTKAELASPRPTDLLTVEVNDPIGHQQVKLEGIRPTVTVKEIVAMAVSEMQLPPNIDWDLRDDNSSRLLPEQQQVGKVARQESPHVRATMQPNAGLG
jgi:hypothetical protein